MVSNHINMLLRQALTTFNTTTTKQELFRPQLEKLKSLLDITTAGDVNFPPEFMSEAIWRREGKAPMTYIDIYDDELITMGIFVLKPNFTLPLHDHPQMYGLIKVLAGTVKVTSYSICNTDSQSYPQNVYPMILTAERMNDAIADASTECSILEPLKRNLHEITSINGPAAFLDILSPPYQSHIPNYGPRKCSYFRVVKEILPCVYQLEETETPTWVWNDTYQYTGPKLE